MSLHIFEHRVVGPLACNCYVIGDPVGKEAIVIDPGDDAEELAGGIQARGLTVKAIVATHAHFDHIVAAGRLRELTGAPFLLHRADNPLLDWMQESGLIFLGAELPPPPEVDVEVAEGDKLAAGDVELAVLHTPGHSPGSICLVAEDAVFSGDTLFAGSIGRTDLPGGDTQALLDGVEHKLFPLGGGLAVYPGHGPATTLERERRTNPFVGRGRVT
ncbi:MBL fold metallo-hydrolase [soil metagenome]